VGHTAKGSRASAAQEEHLTGSLAGKLLELNELKEAQLITQEEYEAKRAELLRRMELAYPTGWSVPKKGGEGLQSWSPKASSEGCTPRAARRAEAN